MINDSNSKNINEAHLTVNLSTEQQNQLAETTILSKLKIICY